MLAGIALVLVHDLATVDPVLQYQVERATGERLAAPASARGTGPAFAGDAVRFELRLQQPHRAELGITLEDVADGLSLALDWGKLVIAGSVAKRWYPAHPHALLLRRGDLVADTLAGDFPLELG